jgi:hypothetical protein
MCSSVVVVLPADVYAPAPSERTQTVHAWIQHLIIQRIVSGGIDGAIVTSSIQARIHNLLSEAMLGYEQCKCALSF